MDRVQMILLGLPLLLFCTDLLNLFTPPPPSKPPHHPPHHHVNNHVLQPKQELVTETLNFPTEKSDVIGGIGVGNTVTISFCSSCSYRGTAVTMNKMLDSAFPGINVILENHPPTTPRRLAIKLVPVAQIGVIGTVMAGEHIFPMIGVTTLPSWYYSLRANRFGTMASTWLIGNVVQNFLQSTGAFEVYVNNELVYSKLKEGRFPGEIELRDLIGRRIATSDIRL